MTDLPQRLLVIEEDNPLRDTLITQLRGKNIRVTAAATAAEAANVLLHEAVDLVMIAGVLPHHETFNLLAEVRRNRKHRQLPVILMSSYYFSPGFHDMSKRLQNTRYVVRPAPLSEILSMITELLAHPASGPKRGP